MTGSFVRVRCQDCENEQIIFNKAATEIGCAVCGHTLARPTGGLADIESEIVAVVEARTGGGEFGEA